MLLYSGVVQVFSCCPLKGRRADMLQSMPEARMSESSEEHLGCRRKCRCCLEESACSDCSARRALIIKTSLCAAVGPTLELQLGVLNGCYCNELRNNLLLPTQQKESSERVTSASHCQHRIQPFPDKSHMTGTFGLSIGAGDCTRTKASV